MPQTSQNTKCNTLIITDYLPDVFFLYILVAYSSVTSLYEDEFEIQFSFFFFFFEIQFSIEVIDNLVFPPAWLLKINFIIDSF